jgi:hypothetical protein
MLHHEQIPGPSLGKTGEGEPAAGQTDAYQTGQDWLIFPPGMPKRFGNGTENGRGTEGRAKFSGLEREVTLLAQENVISCVGERCDVSRTMMSIAK